MEAIKVDKEEKWITTKNGKHLLLDEDGTIISGGGENLNGKNVNVSTKKFHQKQANKEKDNENENRQDNILNKEENESEEIAQKERNKKKEIENKLEDNPLIPEKEIDTLPTDIDIARKMLEDDNEGIYPQKDYFILPLRITGTGETKRKFTDKDGEVREYTVDRPADEFLTQRFLDMCIGLPVCFLHPKEKNVNKPLDYSNYNNYIIGTVFYPYIKGNEVWGFAKIYNLDLLKLFEMGIKSTSPYVVAPNIIAENGKISERLESINHIAIVPSGHWDNGKPALIDEVSNNSEVKNMAEKTPELKEEIKEIDKTKKVDEAPVEEQEKKTEQEDVELDKSIKEQLSEMGKQQAEIAGAVKQFTEMLENYMSGQKTPQGEASEMNSVAKIDETKTDKRGIIDRIAGEVKSVGGDEEIIRTIIGQLEKLAYTDSTAGKADADTSKIAPAIQEPKEEFINEEDERKKEELVKSISDIADSAHDDLNIFRPVVRAGECASDYINRFFKANKERLPSKYHGLINKIDEATFDLAKDALCEMKKNITSETAKIKSAEPTDYFVPEQPGHYTRKLK